MKTYKIWVVIEEHSPDAQTADQEYLDVTEPISLGEFEDLEAAQNFLDECCPVK